VAWLAIALAATLGVSMMYDPRHKPENQIRKLCGANPKK